MKKFILIVLVIMGSFILLYSKNIKPEKLQNNGVNVVSVSQLHQMLEEKYFILVNVHVPYDGEIPQTDMFIPYNKIDTFLNELPTKNQKIMLYCRSDYISTIAVKNLAKTAFTAQAQTRHQ